MVNHGWKMYSRRMDEPPSVKNPARLLKVRARLKGRLSALRARKTPKRHFDMARWAATYECGTACCIGGEGALTFSGVTFEDLMANESHYFRLFVEAVWGWDGRGLNWVVPLLYLYLWPDDLAGKYNSATTEAGESRPGSKRSTATWRTSRRRTSYEH